MRNKRRILVVDDSAVNRALLKEILGDQYQVSEAADGVSVLDLLLKGEQKLLAVLLDIEMPGLDGFEVLRRIRAESSLADLPVVMVTASNDSETEAKALRLGATDFVTKPFVPEVIRCRVNNAAEKRLLEESVSAQALRELTRRADFDPLTDIYNKDAFYRAARELLDEHPEQSFALVRWNVERFKLINDLYGQEMGDRVLREIAGCLKETLPRDSICGRLTADHFAICVPKAELRPAERVAEATRRFHRLGIDHDIFVDAGVYEIEDPSLPVSQMCDRASLALQTINGKYNHHVAYYTSELRSGILREQDIRNQMGDALRLKQFHVYYQPICSLSTGRPVGAEALVRWIHPERGVISPGDFIPLFEKSGFITELDRYVWEEVCRYLSWRRERGLAPLPISVNASRASLYNSSFCEEIMALTSRYGVEPALFKIEITETAYADNPGQILKSTQKLQSAGYSILMDDFGSGYSSLNTLKDIPVDTLKIDMKFLQGFEQGGRVGTVLISVLRMAKWLNTPIVAEGVETAAQMAFLRSVGCDWIQGYCFARPMPPEEFESYVAQPSPPVPEEKNTTFAYQDFDLLMGGNQLINRLMEGVFGGFGLYEFSGDRIEVIRVNDGYYDILGLTPATIRNTPGNILDSLSPEDGESAKAACRETIRTGRAVRCTLRRRHHLTGRTLYLECLFRQLGGGENTALLCVAFNDITDRLEAEARMRQEQERYRLISENSGTIVLEWDLQEYTFRADPGYGLFTISDCEAQSGATLEDRARQVHPDDWEKFFQFQERERETDYQQAELRLMTREGAYHWCRLTKNYIRNERGQVVRILGTVNDIDRQRRSELALSSTEAQLHSLEENMPGAIFVFSVSEGLLNLEMFSDGLCRITGFDRREAKALFSGRPDVEGIHPDDRAGLTAEVRRQLSQRQTISYSYRLLCKSGDYTWVNLNASPMQVDGELRYYGVLTDIEEQHSVTAQLEAIMSSVDAGIAVYEGDEACTRTYANDNFFSILGCRRETFPGDGEHYYALVAEEYREKLKTAVRRLVSQGRMDAVEYPLRRPSGEIVWLNHRITLMTPVGSPKPVRLTIITDITARRESQRRHELHRYSQALFGIYDEIFEADYGRDLSTLVISRYRGEQSGSVRPLREALHRWVDQYVAPAYRETAKQVLLHPQNWQADREQRLEYPVLAKGQTMWISTYVLPMEGSSYLICHRDITEQKRSEHLTAENALLRAKQQEQERYRIIMERTGAIVVEWDLVHHTFNASQGFEQFVISESDPFALLERDSSMGGLERSDMDSGILILERPLHRTDGSTAWHRLVRADVRDEEGRLLRVVGTVTDIDREKRARLELEETSRRLQTVLDTIPAGIASFTADRVSAALTPEYYSIGRARMLGYTQEELMILCREDPYSLVHPEDRSKVVAAYVQTVRTGREMDLTYRQIGRDGQARWVRATCRLLVTGENRAQLFSVYTDMEDLMEVQQSLIYRDQLSQLLLADSNTATLDYQAETDLLRINHLDAEGKRGVISVEQYLFSGGDSDYAENRADVWNVLNKVLRDGAEQTYEGRFNLDGKGWRWYFCVLTGIRDSHRRIVRVVGTLRDISEQRKARSRYQEQLSVNASLSDNLLSAYRVNLSQMHVEYRWSLKNSESFSEAEILSEEHFRQGCRSRTISPAVAEQCYQVFCPAALRKKFEEGETSVSMDYRIQAGNGGLRWASTQAKLMRKPETGDLMVFYNTWDITDQYLVRALVDSVVQADYDFLMCIDPRDGSYVLFPNQVRATLHFQTKGGDYDSARRRDMLSSILPEDQARWLEELTISNICEALKQAPRYEVRFRLREQDGSVACKQVTCTWLDADRSAIMACRTDITAQVRQETARSEALRQALEKAEEAVREKDRFLSRTSYEIRTPMNAIIGMSGLALAEPKTPDQVKDYLHKIQYAGEYMLTLVSDILDVAQVESGNFLLTPAPCPLRDFVGQLATLVHPSADAKGIRFQLDSSQVRTQAAVMDKIRMLQVFVNLLTAVMQYTAEGGSVSCTMSQAPSEGSSFILRTMIRSDTGLSREFTARMFEPFAVERSELSGSGLELTLAKRLLEAMGGTISVSTQGEDTALMAELPLQEAELPVSSGTPPTLSGDFNFSGRRILVVEDQAINAEVARKLLEQKLFTVETAVNGLEAVNCFQSHDPGWYSAILMDVRMPVLDGLAATREIRRLNRADARTIPILAMTGNAFASDVQASLASGMDAHLEKPINPHLLYQTLAALIFAREGQQKNREAEKRIRQQERIYKLLLAQSRSQVFDYDAGEDQLTISAGGKGHEGVSIVMEFVRKVLPICAVIHPDYRRDVGRLLSDEGKDSEGELLFLGDFNNTGYRWYNAYYKRLSTSGHDRVVGRIDDVDEKTRRTLTLQEKAEFDPITSLYNRATFQELVQNALNGRDWEIDGIAAFVEFDLDNFKLVNDTWGHLMGDQLLKTVGETVRSCCRREDLVGRLGGDEFAIWMEDVGNADNVEEKIRQLGLKFQEATAHLHLGTEVTASFGIAIATPSDKTFEALFQKADVAMYQAKRKGKNCWSVFGSQTPEA